MRHLMLAGVTLLTALILLSGHTTARAEDPYATFQVAPSFTSVFPGDTFTVDIVHDASFPSGGAFVSIAFDPDVLELVEIGRADAYREHGFFSDTGDHDVAETIQMANCTGEYPLAGVALITNPTPKEITGPTAFLQLTFRARAIGDSEVIPYHPSMINPDGSDPGVEVIVASGYVAVGDPSGSSTPPPLQPVAGSETPTPRSCSWPEHLQFSPTPVPSGPIRTPNCTPSPPIINNSNAFPSATPFFPVTRCNFDSPSPTSIDAAPTEPDVPTCTPQPTLTDSPTPLPSPTPSDAAIFVEFACEPTPSPTEDSSSTPSPAVLALIAAAGLAFLGISARSITRRRS